MAEGMLKEVPKDPIEGAVEKLKEKHTPGLVHVPEEPYHSIYPMLQVWDADKEDPDNQRKTKFIYDYLRDKGENVKDMLLTIFTTIGGTPIGETKLGRVYKYLRLREAADKALKQYEVVQSDIHKLTEKKDGN